MSVSPDAVPRSLRLAAAIAWRFLLVSAALVVIGYVFVRLRLVFVPVVVALLLATLLVPPARWLADHGAPRTLAAAASLLGGLLVLAAAIATIGPSLVNGVENLDVSVREGIDRMQAWIVDAPLGISEERLDELVSRGSDELRRNAGAVVGGAFAGAVLVIEVVAGALIALVLVFFFVRDGAALWRSLRTLFPRGAQHDVDEIGRRVWSTLTAYVRGTAIVALVDAVAIGLALFVLGVPLVLPLAVLVFLGAFIPLAGAVVAGFAAAMVALVTEGFVDALIVVAVVIVVQQLEGDLVQPVVVGRAVQLHPVVVLLAVTAGAILWGVIGAFLAVPVAASISTAVRYLRARPRAPTGLEREEVLTRGEAPV